MTQRLALVGRPNVGKSALFNRICGMRIAIVDEQEGITRDRLYADAEIFGRPFEVIDTGGINPRSEDQFGAAIREQAEIAIEEADVLVMVVDARVGVTDLDAELARFLLKTKKPLLLAINKVDNREQEVLIHPFYQLGIAKMVAVSAIQGYQVAEMLLEAWEGVQPQEVETKEETGIQISIVGRANVGKSTLLNTFLDENRCMVSPIAGTTRDSIDVPFEHDGERWTLIDTAGIRRKPAEKEVVDKFAAVRTKRAIERADVSVLLLDVRDGITHQDKKIINELEETGRGCVLLLNKWDLTEGCRMEHALKQIREESPFLAHCPALFISALTGRNVDKILQLAKEVHERATMRHTTGELNRFMEKALHNYPPARIQGRRLRVYYLTQVGTNPLRFVLFVNHPSLMMQSYKQYLINQFRKQFKTDGAPISFILKGKKGKPSEALST